MIEGRNLTTVLMMLGLIAAVIGQGLWRLRATPRDPRWRHAPRWAIVLLVASVPLLIGFVVAGDLRFVVGLGGVALLCAVVLLLAWQRVEAEPGAPPPNGGW